MCHIVTNWNIAVFILIQLGTLFLNKCKSHSPPYKMKSFLLISSGNYLFALFLYSVRSNSILLKSLLEISFTSRHLSAHKTHKLKNCTPPSIEEFPNDFFNQKQRQHGAVIVNFAVAFYMFWAIAIVCDDYFVPCLEIICEKMDLQSDVAGATFMALGSSAPELFASVIG